MKGKWVNPEIGFQFLFQIPTAVFANLYANGCKRICEHLNVWTPICCPLESPCSLLEDGVQTQCEQLPARLPPVVSRSYHRSRTHQPHRYPSDNPSLVDSSHRSPLLTSDSSVLGAQRSTPTPIPQSSYSDSCMSDYNPANIEVICSSDL